LPGRTADGRRGKRGVGMSKYSCSECEYCSGNWKQGKVYCYAKDDFVKPVEIYDRCDAYSPNIYENYGDGE